MSLNIIYNDIFHNMSLIWKFHFGEPGIKKKSHRHRKIHFSQGVCYSIMVGNNVSVSH